MRKPIQAYDRDHRKLVKDRSVVRYCDTLWLYHGAWINTDTGKVKFLISSRRNGKMRLVHDRHRKDVVLEYTLVR